MGLFDKKFCDICSSKIGLLGNRKLEDGNLCKDCAAKLSPWFSDRRKSTVAEIREQLAYREQNRMAVAQFNITRSIGRSTKVLLDENARCFMVTSSRDLAQANPDVIDFSQVTGCDLDVKEHRRELRHADRDGRQVSYIPPRYEYSYDFYMIISVNHPYFDEIRFKLNTSTVNVGQRGIGVPMPPMHGPRPGVSLTQQVVGHVLNAISDPVQPYGATWNAEYNEYLFMGQEIREALMQGRQEARSFPATPPEVWNETAEPVPAIVPVLCPWCGGMTRPDGSGCCEFCGGPVNA